MKLIRNKTFETNSSSCHSISISDKVDFLYTLPVNNDGTIILSGGEFGWEWEKFNDPLTKANYCLTYLKSFENVDLELENMLIDVIKKQTGCSDVIFKGQLSTKFNKITKKYDYTYLEDGEDPIYEYGYIDHQSFGVCKRVFKNEEVLRNFIFNPKSWLYLGNDNYDEPNGFYDDDTI